MDFHKKLRDKGLKATPQRLLILNIISEGGHIDIEDIYNKVKTIVPSISIATIYKNLKLLADKEIIKEVNINSFKQLYEVNTKEHFHLICKRCKKIFDVDSDNIKIKNIVEDKVKNTIDKIEINAYFLCNNCK